MKPRRSRFTCTNVDLELRRPAAALDPLLQVLRRNEASVVFRDFQKRFGLLRLTGCHFEALLGLSAQPE
jgi:hypothetical protein